jgi:hypothetical protein
MRTVRIPDDGQSESPATPILIYSNQKSLDVTEPAWWAPTFNDKAMMFPVPKILCTLCVLCVRACM